MDFLSEIRSSLLKHKVIVFPNQELSPEQLVEFNLQFGGIGEDPFFGHIEGRRQLTAIQRASDEKTSIFAEAFHSDWSFLGVSLSATALYGAKIPSIGGTHSSLIK